MEFCHLHNHTEYSQLDGFGTTENYAKRAKDLGYKFLGISDHSNIDGLIKFQKACKNHDIKPVLGCELYIVPEINKDKGRWHICVFVKNQIGFKNLCKMLTFANTEGFYYRPRITPEILLKYYEGLCISTACMSSFLNMEGGEKLFKNLKEAINKDLYCEIMPYPEQGQKEVNKKCIQLADKYNLKIIASNDCHYIERSDAKAQEVLLAIQRKAKWNDPKRWKFSHTGLHLRTKLEMKIALKRLGFYDPIYMENTIHLAEKCSNYFIPKFEVELPDVPGIKPGQEDHFLYGLCIEGFSDIFKLDIEDVPEYRNRLRTEFKLIKTKNLSKYFLIVWELVQWCKDNEIMIGPGRGSVSGSLIAYLTGITAVDPIEHNLIFSRFINEDRIDLPDIDIDFEDTKRYLIRTHLEETYGKNKVAGVSSFNRMKSHGVVRDVSRVFDIPLGEVDRFTKFIEDNEEGNNIEEAIKQYPEAQEFAYKHPEVVDFSQKLEGQIKNYGQHAAALVISKTDIGRSGRCNLLKREETTLINWEKEDTEYVGLMKLDILGLKLLSILNETKRLIKKNYGKDINLKKIDLNDKEVLKEISDGNTVGLFQMNTWAMTNLIKDIEIQHFFHLVCATALVRPGPFNSGMTVEYIKRKQGGKWTPKHSIYEKITEDTYGIIVFQEQVMEVIHKVAGLSYNIADQIRKIIGKKRDKKEFEPFKKQFMKGCLKQQTLSRQESEEFWEGLQEHAAYSFNRAHAAAYAMLGYHCAWLKKYYPTEFICASLTFGVDAKKPELIQEAYRLGLSLTTPKIGLSHATSWIAKDKKLIVPFIEIKGIGPAGASEATIIKTKRGLRLFFEKEDEEIDIIQRHKGRLGKILEDVGAYNDSNDKDSKDIQKYFDFKIMTDVRTLYKNLLGIVGNIRLDRIDKVASGNLEEIEKLKYRAGLIIYKTKFKGHENLSSCEECDLIKECNQPVHPSPGEYNLMIIGEGPGPEEDQEGEGFIGRSGKKLWRSLRIKGYRRKIFHVTNVEKCYPKISRRPNSEQIRICGKLFLEKEIEKIKPHIILAFGNTSLFFFDGRESGITSMSGKIVWNEKYSAWIVYCLHPAATLYNPENITYYNAGIKSFVKLIQTIKPDLKNML